MTRLPIPVAAAVTLLVCACGGGLPMLDESGAARPTVQGAALILHHPHDVHEFAELPPDLTPVAGASAGLERHSEHLRGTIETTMTPGHVGTLLAVVINNPAACEAPTPATFCGPHEEEFNRVADGGFYLGSGDVAGPDGRIELSVVARVGDTSNVLCRGAANPNFDACETGFSLRDPHRAEVTLVLLDNGPAAAEPELLDQQLASPSPCPDCPPFTAQIAIGFGHTLPALPRPAVPPR